MNLIEKLRRQRNWSQTELGKKLGWTQADVSRAESGQTSLNVDKIRKLAKVFGVKASIFLDEQTTTEAGSLQETGGTQPSNLPRDPLLDQIMSSAYNVWFNSSHRDDLPLDRLPELVYICYNRLRQQPASQRPQDIQSRLMDMLAVMETESRSKKSRKA